MAMEVSGLKRRILRAATIAALWLQSGVLAASAADPADVALDKFFAGAVVGLKGGVVRLRYDFSDAGQMKDWEQFRPFPIATDPGDSVGISDARMNVRGNTGVRHKGEFEGDLVVTCKLIPDGIKDIGAYMFTTEAATDYMIYTIAETYFHNWDKHAGGATGMMKFGKQWAAPGGGWNGFRYMTERPLATAPTPGHGLPFTFGRRGGKEILELGDDLKIEDVEPGNAMKTVIPGFYSIKSSLSVDDVVVEGKLTAKWLELHHVALRTDKPLAPDGPATGVDPAVSAMIEAYAKGEEKSPSKLLTVIGDPAHAETDRKAATAAVKAGPRRALSAVIDLLYSGDTAARAFGLEIVKAMTGKTYGYEPKAGELARRAAIGRLNDDIKAHQELLQGGGG